MVNVAAYDPLASGEKSVKLQLKKALLRAPVETYWAARCLARASMAESTFASSLSRS